MELTIIIQAGGESRRMGANKALLSFRGVPLIQRVVERMRPLGDELLVITNQPGLYQFLGLPMVADIFPGKGALGGLYTALRAAAHPLVGVVACDMPFANPALLAAERDACAQDWDVILPVMAGQREPLHAVYRKEACLVPVRKALDENRLRMDSWFGEVRLREYGEEEIRRSDPEGRAFLNVNTPEEFRRAEELE
jgi:molybdopterin-guanine dinucleotide biosynthesis protein A